MVILLIVIAVILLAVSVPVRAELYFEYSAGGVSAEAGIKVLGIRLRMPRKKTEQKSGGADDTDESEGRSDKVLKAVLFIRENFSELKELIYAVLEYMRKRLVKIKKLSLRTIIGVPDAMETALLYGAEAAFVYNVLGVMDRHMRLVHHETELKPDFKTPRFYVQFTADIRTNVFHLLVMAVLALRRALPIIKKMKMQSDENENAS